MLRSIQKEKRCYGKVDIAQVEYMRFMLALSAAIIEQRLSSDNFQTTEEDK